jgi:PAS domain S-box-containing protein
LRTHPDSSARALVLLFVLLALGIVGVGTFYYRFASAQFQRDAERQLAAIADLKVSELASWRRERFSDARFYQNNLSLARLVRDALARPDDEAVRDELRTWFSDTQRSHGYGVFLLDTTGGVRLSLPDDQPQVDPSIGARVPGVLASRQVDFVDFYRSATSDRVHLALIVPLRAVEVHEPPQAVLVWRLDPSTYLYPLLASWPTPSVTSESLLVRRDDDHTVVLNPLRRDLSTALTLRTPLAWNHVPSVQAVLGREGVVEAPDYRGVSVLAALRRVPDTPWHLSVRVDQAEVYAPLRERWWWLTSLVGALLLASGAGVGLLWRQQRAQRLVAELRADAALRAQATALRHAHDTLSFHLDNSPLGVIEWDLHFRVIRWSPRAEALFGWTAADVLGRHPSEWEFIHPDDAAAVTVLISDLVAGRLPRNRNVNRNLTKDGRVLHCEWHNSARLGSGETLASIFSLVHDVTDRVVAEQALRTLNEELEQRVRDRTSELHRRNRELEVFTYSVSHDLKAPLRGIDGYSRLLLEDHADELTGDGPTFVHNIRTATANMGRLIDDLLEYSRVERRQMQSTRLALRPFVDAVIAARVPDLAAGTVDVRLNVPDVTVSADEQGLTLALRNLLDNALKFAARSETPVVEFGATVRAEAVELQVRDNGIGFDMKYHDRIFDIFQRLHRAEEYAGTGVGLAIVRKSMERMGGRVWAESAPGRGATFVLAIPRES